MLFFSSRALLAVTNQSPVTIVKTTCMHRNRKPYNSFFIANMVRGMDHVHVLPTMPTQWNMATILHLKPSHSGLYLNPTAQKDNRGVLGTSFRAEEFSEIVGYSNMADYSFSYYANCRGKTMFINKTNTFLFT